LERWDRHKEKGAGTALHVSSKSNKRGEMHPASCNNLLSSSSTKNFKSCSDFFKSFSPLNHFLSTPALTSFRSALYMGPWAAAGERALFSRGCHARRATGTELLTQTSNRQRTGTTANGSLGQEITKGKEIDEVQSQ